MQEEIDIEGFLSEPTVFKNKDVLGENYIPEQIVHRKEQIKKILSELKYPFFGQSPDNIFLYGKSGTGKTVSIKYIQDKLNQKAQEEEINYKVCYVNCGMDSITDTVFRVVKYIAENHLNITLTRGISQTEAMEKMWDAIDDNEYIVFLLDEIDYLIENTRDKEKMTSFLYTLTRKRTDKSSIIGITNKRDVLNNIDPRIQSSMKETSVSFPPYNAVQLRDILEKRTEKAFMENVVTDGAIAKCAALAANENGDARRALDIMLKAGKIAEQTSKPTIDAGMIDEANEELDREKILSAAKSQTKQAKLVLYSAVVSYMDQEEIVTGDIYSRYQQVAEDCASKILSQQRVSQILSDLDMQGLLTAKTDSRGKKGRTREIAIPYGENLMKQVKEELEETLV